MILLSHSSTAHPTKQLRLFLSNNMQLKLASSVTYSRAFQWGPFVLAFQQQAKINYIHNDIFIPQSFSMKSPNTPKRCTASQTTTFLCKHTFTCIVMDVLDRHGRLRSVVAKTSVLLQQLQTFIAVRHWTPTVISTQHCYQNHYVDGDKTKRGLKDCVGNV